MTLEEAIKHAEEAAYENEKEFGLCPYPSQDCDGTQDCRRLENGEGKGCLKCAAEHRQLAKWLRELQERRKERDYWQEKAHSYEQTIFKLTDAISKQPEIIRCKDCKHKGTKNCVANAWTTIFGVTVKDDFFCGLAEGRTDEAD